MSECWSKASLTNASELLHWSSVLGVSGLLYFTLIILRASVGVWAARTHRSDGAASGTILHDVTAILPPLPRLGTPWLRRLAVRRAWAELENICHLPHWYKTWTQFKMRQKFFSHRCDEMCRQKVFDMVHWLLNGHWSPGIEPREGFSNFVMKEEVCQVLENYCCSWSISNFQNKLFTRNSRVMLT